MAGHECYHCKQWVEEGEAHDCWTTTEGALTKDLSDDLRDAYARLREAATEFGEQRVYASHNSIMFARKACYFFVRPKRNFLELCIFLGRAVRAPQVRKAVASSKVKVAHIVHVRHRDEVEAPITEWIQEAYHLQDALAVARPAPNAAAKKRMSKPAAKSKRSGGGKGATKSKPARARTAGAKAKAKVKAKRT